MQATLAEKRIFAQSADRGGTIAKNEDFRYLQNMLNGYLWPIIISLLVLGLAYVLFYMLPEITDFEMSFVWVIVGFLAVYIIAAVYLGFRLPSPFTANAASRNSQETISETVITDVTVR